MWLFDNLTQAVGLTAFLVTCLCCLMPRRAGGWRWLSAIYVALAIEMIFETRHELRLHLNDMMQQGGLYEARGGYQLAIAGLVIILLLLALYQLVRHRLWRENTTAGKWAWTATAVLLLLFGVEYLSMHAVDALLYQTTGGVMRIAWCWLALAGITTISAIFETRNPAPHSPDSVGTEAD